jgi:AraC-like DNA-binding protein
MPRTPARHDERGTIATRLLAGQPPGRGVTAAAARDACYPAARMLVAAATFRRLCRARARLLEEAAAPAEERLTIDALARQSGMSPFHFIRSFGAVFGVTPHQARIGARLDRARQLLAGGELSVTEVCLEVGFESLGSFSALFARRVGEPPSRYRRRVRAQGVVPGAPPGALPASAFPGCLTLMGRLPADAFRSFREAGAS